MTEMMLIPNGIIVKEVKDDFEYLVEYIIYGTVQNSRILAKYPVLEKEGLIESEEKLREY